MLVVVCHIIRQKGDRPKKTGGGGGKGKVDGSWFKRGIALQAVLAHLVLGFCLSGVPSTSRYLLFLQAFELFSPLRTSPLLSSRCFLLIFLLLYLCLLMRLKEATLYSTRVC